jgi:hypothetical protein
MFEKVGMSEKRAIEISGHKTRSSFDRYRIVSLRRHSGEWAKAPGPLYARWSLRPVFFQCALGYFLNTCERSQNHSHGWTGEIGADSRLRQHLPDLRLSQA